MAEVPREVSLAISITNCAYLCHGCHSPDLRKDTGEPLLRDLDMLIERYKGLISCVCLLGEGQNPEELLTALRWIRWHGLKSCLYTGCDHIAPFETMLSWLDYIKLGPYDKSLGGLDQPKTNQRFYCVRDGMLFDETRLFQRKKDDV